MAERRGSTPRHQKTDEFNLSTVTDSLIDHRKLIATTTMAVLLAGCAFAFISAPVYQSNILIKIDDTADPAPTPQKDFMAYVSRPFEEKSSTEREMQILGSRNIVARAVSDVKLDITATPRYFPVIGRAVARYADNVFAPGIFFGMGGYVWGAESIQVSELTVPEKLLGEQLILRSLGDGRYELTSSKLGTTLNGKVGALQSFTTPLGPIMLHVTALKASSGDEFVLKREPELVVVEELQRAIKISEQGNKSSLLNVSMQGRDPHELVRTLAAIADEYQHWSEERKSNIAKASLDYLNAQLPAMRAQVEEAETQYNEYRNQHAVIDVSEEGRILLKQFADQSDQLATLQRRRQDLSSSFSPSHPSMIGVDQQIVATQRAIDKLNDRVKTMPATEQGTLALLRDVRVSTDLYSTMRNNIEQMRLISAGNAGSVQIIDAPSVPIRPIKPVKWMVLAASLGLGLLLGVGWSVLRDRLLRGVTDTENIEAATGVSVFSTIPYSDKQDAIARRRESGQAQPLPLALGAPRDPAIESLRMLRSALQYLVVGARNNVVMMTGPLPGIGKSFISANLATVLAAGGKRVLLIDGDLRKGKLHEHFGIQNKPGLSDVLFGSHELNDVIIKDVTPRLDLLQTGPYPPNAADLLSEPNFQELVERASAQYDTVLIDTPALLAVSDAGVMAPVAGLILLVVRYGDTLVGEIEASIKRFMQNGARVNGILLNGVKVHNSNYALSRRYGTLAYVAHDYESGGK